MANAEALAEVFLTALLALPKTHTDRILIELVKDKGLRRELMDLGTIEKRKKEPSRLFRDYLRAQKGLGCHGGRT